MKRLYRSFRPVLPASLLCLGLALQAVPVRAAQQPFMVIEPLTGAATTSNTWTFSGSAFLTAPSIDPVGSGWLRLTGLTNSEQGKALDSETFASSQPMIMKFNYVSWGGTGADGMAVFLYDPSVGSPMSGSVVGGGLGYCGGEGGYLAIGLDEFGNFSNYTDTCGSASGTNFGSAAGGGTVRRPETLAIRGPVSAYNYYVTGVSVSGGIDNPGVTTRPSPKTVLLYLNPKLDTDGVTVIGYTISAQIQTVAGGAYTSLFSGVDFPYPPPANLAIGFSASTGGATNFHELHALKVSTPDNLSVALTPPATILQGATAAYTLTVTNNGTYAIDSSDNTYSTDVPAVASAMSASLSNVTWSCTGSGGASCDASSSGVTSGSGNISTSNVTLPVNGVLTYTINGTLDSAATCGSTITSAASADFPDASHFADPDETDNSPTATSTVACHTIAVNPASLSYSAQATGSSSTAQTITVTGTNGTTINGVAISGDYSQTSNCVGTTLTGTSCTINVKFSPTALGTRNGAVTITSTAVSSPTSVALTGTGTNAVPDAFTFATVTDVTAGSEQVSNAITVMGTNVASTISVSNGAEYSINGGAWASTPGTVSPGATVQVRIAASSTAGGTATATVSIGGVASTFTVTTADPVPDDYTITSTSSTASATPGSTIVSSPVTVSGTDVATSISISAGAKYRINGGAWTSDPGMVNPGDTVEVQLAASSTPGATVKATLNIGGVPSTFAVTTVANSALSVTSAAGGGGAFGAWEVLLLAGVLLARLVGSRLAARRVMASVAALALVALLSLGGVPAQAQQAGAVDGLLSNVYVGARAGAARADTDTDDVTRQLQSAGYLMSATGYSKSGFTGTLYAGYDVRQDFGAELGLTYLGRIHASLYGVAQGDLAPVLKAAEKVTRGGGYGVSLAGRYRWDFSPRLALDLRAGPYLWETRSDLYQGSAMAMNQIQRGVGYTVGGGPRFALTDRLGAGISADYFGVTSYNHFLTLTAGLEYHLP